MYVTKGDDVQVLGSLSVLATLLQTKGCISTHTHTLNCFTIASFSVYSVKSVLQNLMNQC